LTSIGSGSGTRRFLIAFADDPQHSLGVINIADVNLSRLADAQATGIH
jgi:hypothetical protein